MRRALGRAAAALALVSISACGSDASDSAEPSGGTSSESSGSGTELTIEVSPGDGARTSSYDLRCDPPGGDHPQPEQACDAIATAGVGVFDPVPSDQACSQVFGGPQNATVTGTYAGRQVDATFIRSDGCQIDRWEKLGTTVFNLPLQ